MYHSIFQVHVWKVQETPDVLTNDTVSSGLRQWLNSKITLLFTIKVALCIQIHINIKGKFLH